jgi:hypothetical protein
MGANPEFDRVYPGSEGLGFAAPVQTACLTLVVCVQAS